MRAYGTHPAKVGLEWHDAARFDHAIVHERAIQRANLSSRGVQGIVACRRLSEHERQAILDAAHSERFADFSVREIYATLLDEGVYLASIATMYRILRAAGETPERRHLATHPARVKPELAATAPGQVWSWDITKLLGPQKWTYYHLYVVLDVYSRYVVGWRLETRESATLAEELFAQTITREGVDASALTVHADGGTAMTSKSLAHLFADLGVTQKPIAAPRLQRQPVHRSAFQNPQVRPSVPGHFANIEQARDFCRDSSPGTTSSIGTPVSHSSRLKTSITDGQTSGAPRDATFFITPGARIPNAS